MYDIDVKLLVRMLSATDWYRKLKYECSSEDLSREKVIILCILDTNWCVQYTFLCWCFSQLLLYAN
jgi:hypothetical protein